jgi:DNA replication protein DnaC
LAALTGPERHDLLEVLEDRSERASTVITSQVLVNAWHALIGEATLADAICDRLIHTAYIIELQGSSLRETRAKAVRTNPDEGDTESLTSAAPRPPGGRKRP